MQFIDLEAQQIRIREQISSNIQKVLDHGQYIMGPEIGALEKRLAAYVGVKMGCNMWISQYVYIDELHPEAGAIAKATVPLTADYSYDGFVRGLRPIRRARAK